MEWQEFADLLAGLNEQTPLVKVAQIRTETDREALKGFTPEQRRMNAEWKKARALSRKKQETDGFLQTIEQTLSRLFGSDHGDECGRGSA